MKIRRSPSASFSCTVYHDKVCFQTPRESLSLNRNLAGLSSGPVRVFSLLYGIISYIIINGKVPSAWVQCASYLTGLRHPPPMSRGGHGCQ